MAEGTTVKDFTKARDWELKEWAKGGRWISEDTQAKAKAELARRETKGLGRKER